MPINMKKLLLVIAVLLGGKDVDVRTMEGGSGGEKRAVFNTPGTNSPRFPDGKTPTGTKEQIRRDSHLKQNQ